jgi:hypothetical protein
VGKFTSAERTLIKSIVASLSIKQIPEAEIINEIYHQTNKTISRVALFNNNKRNKRDSFNWYKTMREGEYEYIHEFKERINEIVFLQKKHHQIIDTNEYNPSVQQTSLAELHRLSITLSNLFDVAPTIVNDVTLSTSQQTKATTTETHFIV